MEPEESKHEEGDKFARKERQIPSGAKHATDAARSRVLQAGIDVIVVRGDKLVRLSPNGKQTVVGEVKGRTRKELKSYSLVWKPQPRG